MNKNQQLEKEIRQLDEKHMERLSYIEKLEKDYS